MSFFTNEFWEERKPFKKSDLIQWLHTKQSFQDTIREFEGRKYSLKKGEILASVRYLAEITGWSRARVERFLKRDTNDTKIEVRGEDAVKDRVAHPVTVIKLLTSSYFSDSEDALEDRVEDTREKKRGQGRDKKRGRIQKVTESAVITGSTESTESTLYNIYNNTPTPKKPYNPDCEPEENDCWFNSKEEWLEVCKQVGDNEAYLLLREVTQWVRKKNHLEGKFWQMDCAKLIKSFYDKHAEKGKRYFYHPERGEGFYFDSEIKRVA